MYLLGLEKNIRTCNEFEMQEHMKMLLSCFQEYDLNLTICFFFFFFFLLLFYIYQIDLGIAYYLLLCCSVRVCL